MTTHLSALGNRVTTITALVALGFALVLIAAPSAAHAASSPATAPLAQGTGMHAKPSIRVRVVQRALRHRGYSLGQPGVDGRFGPLTAAAVRRFQARAGLAVDGIVGGATRRALHLRSLIPQRTKRRPQASHGAKAKRTKPTTKTHRHAAPATSPKPAPAQSTPAKPAPAKPAPAQSTPSTSTEPKPAPGQSTQAKPAPATTTPATTKTTRHRAERAGILPLRWIVGVTGVALIMAVLWALAQLPDREAPARKESRSRPGSRLLGAGARVIGYVTLPADAGNGNGHHEDPTGAIRAVCERAGWELIDVVRDRENGHPVKWPRLVSALERVAGGDARAVIVSDLERVSRGIRDGVPMTVRLPGREATLIAHHIDGHAEAEGGRPSTGLIICDGVVPVANRGPR